MTITINNIATLKNSGLDRATVAELVWILETMLGLR